MKPSEKKKSAIDISHVCIFEKTFDNKISTFNICDLVMQILGKKACKKTFAKKTPPRRKRNLLRLYKNILFFIFDLLPGNQKFFLTSAQI